MQNYTTVGCTSFGASKRRPKPLPKAGVGGANLLMRLKAATYA